jgi:hypothetical protein
MKKKSNSLKEKYEVKKLNELKSLNEAFSASLARDLSKSIESLEGKLFSNNVFLKIPGMDKLKDQLIASFKFIMSDEEARNEDESAGFFKKLLGGKKGSLTQAEADELLLQEVKKLEIVLSSIQNIIKTLREVMDKLETESYSKGSEKIGELIQDIIDVWDPSTPKPFSSIDEVKKALVDSAGDTKGVLDAELLVQSIIDFTIPEVKELISVTDGSEKTAEEIAKELEKKAAEAEKEKEALKKEKMNEIMKDLSGMKEDDFKVLSDEDKNKAVVLKFPEFEKYLKALRNEGFLKV